MASKLARSLLIAVAAVGGLLVGALAFDEDADAWSYYFPKLWTADAEYAFGARSSPLTSSTAETSLHTADDGWDGVSGNWFDWNWGGENNSVAYATGGCSSPVNGRVYLVSRALGGTTTAVTSLCTQSNEILRGWVGFDNTSRTWYVGSGTPTPSGATDLRSHAVHEMGHAAGWVGHLSAGCTDSSRPTMCPGTPAGSTYWRSLESDDTFNIAAAY